MSKTLSIINFVLAIALAAICVIQWQREAAYHQQIYKLDKVGQELAIKLEEEEKKSRGLAEDLTGFKDRNAKMKVTIDEQESIISSNQVQLARNDSELKALRSSVALWEKAVKERDERMVQQNEVIKKASDEIKKVAGERDELVKKYNGLVAQQNDVVEKYNELVKRFKEYQEQVEKAQSGKSKDGAK